MKKIVATILLTTILIQPSYAKITQEDIKEALIDYGIPCLLSFGAGMILANNTNTATTVGGAGCIAIGGATYIQKSRSERSLSEARRMEIEQMILAHNKKADDKVSQIEEAQKKQIDDMKAVLREVIAERMLAMESEMKEFISHKLESGELMPKLEENLKAAMKKEIIAESKSAQKTLVEKCVEETIKEVIAKPIGVPVNGTGVE